MSTAIWFSEGEVATEILPPLAVSIVAVCASSAWNTSTTPEARRVDGSSSLCSTPIPTTPATITTTAAAAASSRAPQRPRGTSITLDLDTRGGICGIWSAAAITRALRWAGGRIASLAPICAAACWSSLTSCRHAGQASRCFWNSSASSELSACRA